MSKFEIGKSYESRCFGDHELIEQFKVIARTEKNNNGHIGIRTETAKKAHPHY